MAATTDITGGIKFFENNLALFRDGNTASASTNDESAKYVLDINQYTRWESVGSDDGVIETLTISLDETTTLDRLFLIDHNFKNYTVKYNGGTEFTTVSNLDGDLVGGIVETTYDKNTSYYKFDSVEVDTIEIVINTTQVADAEKYIYQVIATRELHTFTGFPRVRNVAHNRNIRGAKAISGRNVVQKSYETFSFRLGMATYPVQADVDLVDDLHEREASFLVWLCGGRYGSEYFKVEQRGWRLKDIYNMQVNRPVGANYEKGIYQNGVNKTVAFVEVI